MPTVITTPSMTHSSLSFATFNVTDAPIGLSSGIGTGALLVTIAREGNVQIDGAAEVDGTRLGTIDTLG